VLTVAPKKALVSSSWSRTGITAATLVPDKKTVATCSIMKGRGMVRFWEPETGEPKGRSLKHESQVTDARYGADGKTVVTYTEGSAYCWDAETGRLLGTGSYSRESHRNDRWQTAHALLLKHKHAMPADHVERVEATIAVSPDGRLLLTGSLDGTARLWDAETGKSIGLPLVHQGGVISVAFAPDGVRIATGSRDNTARVWSLEPIQGTPEELSLWAQVITGMALDVNGTVRRLDPSRLEERREALRRLGSPLCGLGHATPAP
jgi:WD40 repeat protein